MIGQEQKPGRLPIEALAATLFIAILAAVAVPMYLATVEEPMERACRANMQTIASAEEAWKESNAGHGYTTNLIDLNDQMGSIPGCPLKGNYRITISGSGRLSIYCSKRRHGRFDLVPVAR